MAELIDIPWFDEQADDDATRRCVREIAAMQRAALERNELTADPAEMVLRLAGLEIHVEKGGAFCALELFQEIFRDDGHFQPPGFDDPPPAAVADLGANHGFYALRVKQKFPQCRMVCVEPNPYVFPLLEKNLRANGFGDVAAVHAAVAASDGPMDFELVRAVHSISGRGLSLVERSWMRPEFVERVQVPGARLERLLDEQGFDRIDILKVDVEGAEADVLADARRVLPRVDRAVVERHSPELGERVACLLAEEGLDLVFDEDPAGERYYADMYFRRQRNRPP